MRGFQARQPYNRLNGRRERLGSVAARSDRGSATGFGGTGGQNDLQACCYGEGMEGLRCYHGILRGTLASVCPVLRHTHRRGGPEPPVGATFCILQASFCLPWAGQLARSEERR